MGDVGERYLSQAPEFATLAQDAQNCRVCLRMADRRAVLSVHNGKITSRILFVAEAPGRLGADRTGIPLCGDQSGRNFDQLLRAAGLCRDDIFITNAVLCNPRDQKGRNTPPTLTEVRACAPFLRRTIALIDPAVVVALGVVALKALSLISPHDVVLRRDVAQPRPWNDRLLIPLYHPGPRAQLHRSFAEQITDFMVLRPLFSRVKVA